LDICTVDLPRTVFNATYRRKEGAFPASLKFNDVRELQIFVQGFRLKGVTVGWAIQELLRTGQVRLLTLESE
jgi:hypothetical protein